MIEKGIIDLSSYTSKCYALVVLSDSEVTFPREEVVAAFCPFLYCLLFIHNIA